MYKFNIDDYVSLGRADFSPMFKKLPSNLSFNCQDNVIVVRKYPTGIRVASRPCDVGGRLTCMMCHCGPEPELPATRDEEYEMLRLKIHHLGSASAAYYQYLREVRNIPDELIQQWEEP